MLSGRSLDESSHIPEGEQCVFILYTSICSSYGFIVILDINVSVFMLIGINFNVKEVFFQGLVLRVAEIILIKDDSH